MRADSDGIKLEGKPINESDLTTAYLNKSINKGKMIFAKYDKDLTKKGSMSFLGNMLSKQNKRK